MSSLMARSNKKVVYDYTAPTESMWEPTSFNVPTKSTQKQPQDLGFNSMLECPVCFSVPEGEIFNCVKGHSICGQCRKKLTVCVMCTGQYTQARNFMMEALIFHLAKHNKVEQNVDIGQMHVNCIYMDDGCKKQLLPSELEVHEFECKFRPVQCIVESSSKCVPKPYVKISKYLQHLKDHHKIRGLSEESGMFTKVDRLFVDWSITVTWPPFYLQYDGRTFLRCAAIKNRNVSFWVQLIGHDDEADRYQAVITLSSPSKKTMKISWTIPVHSLRRSRQHIEQSKGLACISTKRILPYCTQGEEFGDRIATYTWASRIVLSRVDE